jgi:hypothetical protein
VSLVENTAQSAYGDLGLPGRDYRIDDLADPPDELDVAPLLTCLEEPDCFEPAPDFSEGQRPKGLLGNNISN